MGGEDSDGDGSGAGGAVVEGDACGTRAAGVHAAHAIATAAMTAVNMPARENPTVSA